MDFAINKTYQKILINIVTYISFVLAYVMYGFGLMAVRSTFTIIMNFMTVGLFFYIIFEVIATFSYSCFIKFVPNFGLEQKEYKYYLRLIIIARNILVSLVNIIFIFFPIASVWGTKLSHIIFTILAVFLGTYLLRKKLANNMYRSLAVIGAVTFVYLMVYLFCGVIA